MMIYGYTGKILEINLSDSSSSIIPTPLDICDKFIGGKGLGAWLLSKYTKEKIDPLSEENILVFASGPLTGTLAPATRGCIVSKSPLTNIFCDSYAGGHFFQEMKFCGYDAIIVKGKSNIPAYIVIQDDNISIRPADTLWGLDTYETYEKIHKDLESNKFNIACIGPAGENLVKYALIDLTPHRQAGRCGLGAVMGSKKLKALAVKGSGGIRVANPEKFKNTVLEAWTELKNSPDTQYLGKVGTPGSADFANGLGFFPVRNFTDGVYDHVDKIAAKAQCMNYNLRDIGCFACPIHCTKIGKIRNGKYSGTVGDTIEYETLGLLGGNIEIKSLEEIAYLNNLCDRYGIDTVSTGNMLGFISEAYEKGLIPNEYCKEIINFGDAETYIELIKKITFRKGIGDILAEGVNKVCEKWCHGTEKLAVHVKGLELPAWGPRGSAGMGLAFMTADRGGCHQRAYPIAYEQGASNPVGETLEPLSTLGKGQIVAWEQNYFSAIYSLVFCDFTRTGMQPETYAKLLSYAICKEVSLNDLIHTGERIWNLIRMYNLREGLTSSEDKLPSKLKNPISNGPYAGHGFSHEDQEKMLQDYYAARGWDKNGIPTPAKLKELKLDENCVIPYI